MIRARTMLASLAAATTLAGCTMMGGYGGVSVGYGGGYDPYYDDGYYGDGYYGNSYYGSPYYGWYQDYYYPGLGAYVYDRGGRRHAWNAAQRRHWEARRAAIRDRRELRENWSDYRRERREDRRADNRESGRDGWRDDRRDGQDGRRDGWRERRESGQDWRGERDQARRERRTDAPAPAPAIRRGGTDAVRAPRAQMEAQPPASRPEPRQERIQSPSAAEELAPRQPE